MASARASSESSASSANNAPSAPRTPSKGSAARCTTSSGGGGASLARGLSVDAPRAVGEGAAPPSVGSSMGVLVRPTCARGGPAEQAASRHGASTPPSFRRGRSMSVPPIPQALREEPAGLAGAEDPQLVSGARRADVEQVARFVFHGIGGLAHLHEHDVVELQPLHLTDVRHVHARTEGEFLIGDAPQEGHLTLAQALVVEVRLLREASDDRDRRAGLAVHQLTERLAQVGDGVTGLGHLEELDGGPAAGGDGGLAGRQRPEHGLGEVEDLACGAIAELERLHLDVLEPQLAEHRLPVGEAVVHVEPLGGVSCEGDAAAAAQGVDDDRELDRAQILGLVDEYVLVDERLLGVLSAAQHAAGALQETQQQGVVLPIEGGALFQVLSVDAFVEAELPGTVPVVSASGEPQLFDIEHLTASLALLSALAVACPARTAALLGGSLRFGTLLGFGHGPGDVADAPGVDPIELRGGELPRSESVEALAEQLPIREQIGPEGHHVLGAGAGSLELAAQDVAGGARQGAAGRVEPALEAGDPVGEGTGRRRLPGAEGRLGALILADQVDEGALRERGGGVDALVDEAQHRRVLLHARDRGGRVLVVAPWQEGKVGGA